MQWYLQCCGNDVVGCFLCSRMFLECQLSAGLSKREEGALIIDLPWPFQISGYRWEPLKKYLLLFQSGMVLCQCIHRNASEFCWQVLLSLVLMCYWNKFRQGLSTGIRGWNESCQMLYRFQLRICIPADNCFLHTIDISSISLKLPVSCNSCTMCNLYWMWTGRQKS